MRIQNKIVLGFAIALTITSAASAQDRSEPGTPAQTGVATTLQVAGKPYHFEGKASCQHEPEAYIYSMKSELWTVRHSGRQQSLTLTLWRPKNGSGDMFSLYVTAGGKSRSVNTVRAGGQDSISGSGKVNFRTSGAGGTFTIHATTEDGVPITGTTKCGAFSAVIAEGG